ncbi:MAG: hypothetical protein KAV82_01435, partial [Phycisphaerae bacterium]|nr:hypothetical protein [Phycisphaerae bacterium]
RFLGQTPSGRPRAIQASFPAIPFPKGLRVVTSLSPPTYVQADRPSSPNAMQQALPACVVPLSELSRRLKASKHPTCSLSLSDDGERLLINGGRVEHALQTYNPAEFPLVPSQLEGDSIEIDAAELVHAVKVTSHAVAKEPSRYAINGILLESNEKGSRLVATDVAAGFDRDQIEVHQETVPLYGYQGDERP